MMDAKHVVLAVDDEPNVVKSLQDLLRLGYHVLGATNANEAMEALRRQPVAVVLADQRMPDTSGIELLCRIRNEHPEVVRLLFTGFADFRVIEGAINQAHVYRYIPKPWDPQELQDAIREACQYHEILAADTVGVGKGISAPSCGYRSRAKLRSKLLWQRVDESLVDSANTKRAIAMAVDTQRRMIPQRPPNIPGFDIGAMYSPGGQLSGDFYDFIDLPPNNLGIVIGDVIGSGLRAALLMAAIRSSLRAHASDIYAIGDVMSKVDRDLQAEMGDGDFVTIFYGVLDYRTCILTYTNEGHCPPMLFRDDRVHLLAPTGSLLGVESPGRYPMDTVLLQPGDLFVAYTDGVSEAMNPTGELFGEARIEQALRDFVERGDEIQDFPKRLYADVRQFAGSKGALDDITVVAVRVLPSHVAWPATRGGLAIA